MSFCLWEMGLAVAIITELPGVSERLIVMFGCPGFVSKGYTSDKH